MSFPRILSSLAARIVTCLVFVGASALQVVTANPPIHFPPSPDWFATPSNMPLIASVALAGLSALASFAQVFGPKPSTSAEVAAQGTLTQTALLKVAQSVSSESAALKLHHGETRRSIDDLRVQIDQLTNMLVRTNGVDPARAAGLHDTLIEMAESQQQDDLAIVERAISGDPIVAADELMATIRSSVRAGAVRAAQAARIYAAVAPQKAIQAYELAINLDPKNIWIAIEYANILREKTLFDKAIIVLENSKEFSTSSYQLVAIYIEISLIKIILRDFIGAELDIESAEKECESWELLEPRSRNLWIAKSSLWNHRVALLKAKGDLEGARKLSQSAGAMSIFIHEENITTSSSLALVARYMSNKDYQSILSAIYSSNEYQTLWNITVGITDAVQVQNSNFDILECLRLADVAIGRLEKIKPIFVDISDPKMIINSKWAEYYFKEGDFVNSEIYIRESLRLSIAKNSSPNASETDRFNLAQSNWKLAKILSVSGKRSEARSRYRSAIDLFDAISKKTPNDPAAIIALQKVIIERARFNFGHFALVGAILNMPKMAAAISRYANSGASEQDVEKTLKLMRRNASSGSAA